MTLCIWPGCTRPRGDLVICDIHADIVARHVNAKREADEPTPTTPRPSAPIAPRALPNINGRKPSVYYLLVGDLIKVGHAHVVHERLRQYPPNATLLALEPGDPSLEKQRHRELRESLAMGREWFHDTDQVRAVIAAVVAEHGPPKVIVPRASRRQAPKVYFPVETRRAQES